MAILVTGGLGFIGSHTVVELINSGEQIIVIDNLANSTIEVLDNLQKIVNQKISFYKVDCCDEQSLTEIFKQNSIESVIHFAGLKSVGESVKKPLFYYDINLNSVITILKVMAKFSCNYFVFSSSATVYGNLNKAPFTEDMITQATNPYGQSKLMIEQFLYSYCQCNSNFSVICLRYFNPIGAHKSGLIGDCPTTPHHQNLMPILTKVATHKLQCLKIFGNDYETFDGTCVRDYVHVVDLSRGHIAALNYLKHHKGFSIFNLGTGQGVSVLKLIEVFEDVNRVKINFEFTDRRPGDVAISYCSPKKAISVLNWSAHLNVEDMCRDAFNFEKNMSKSVIV